MYNAYRGRVNASGANIQDAMYKISMRQAIDYILNSPSRSQIYLNNNLTYPYSAIVSDIDNFHKKRVLFLPETEIKVGDYVHQNDSIYLAIDQVKDRLYPQLIVELCNSNFTFKTEGMKEIVGYDDFGRPIYQTIKSSTFEIPCVLTTTITSVIDNSIIPLPSGELIAKIPYSPKRIPNLNYLFTHHTLQYKVVSVSFEHVINEVGYVELRMQLET